MRPCSDDPYLIVFSFYGTWYWLKLKNTAEFSCEPNTGTWVNSGTDHFSVNANRPAQQGAKASKQV